MANKKVVKKKAVPKKDIKPLINDDIDTEEDIKRRDYQHNDSIICSAFCELLISGEKLPSSQEIADKCNLSAKTVDRHLKDNSFEDFKQRFRAGNEKVMLNLFRQAATGKSEKMMRLWFELMEGLGSRKQVDITSKGEKIEPSKEIVTLDASNLSTDALKEILKQVNGTTKN
jgi:hypothetical protein